MTPNANSKNLGPHLRPGYWVLFFVLVGFGLRLHQLSFQPLWGDEGWSFYFATQPLPQLIRLTAIDIHPPLYYLLLKGWLFVAGTGPELARFLSVMSGTLLIAGVALLAQKLFGKAVATIAAATTAVMPMAIYYSQEVRMYGLVTLLGVLSFYFLLKRDEGVWFRRAYIITAAAALYTMYYASFLILGQLIYILLTGNLQPRRWLRQLKPVGYVGLLYLPWVLYATPRLVSYVENKRNVEGYEPLSFLSFMGDHLVAFSVGHLPPFLQPHGWAALALVLVACLGFVVGRKQALILYLYLFLPLLLGYVVNLFYPFTPRYFERTLLLAAPAYWLFIAAAIVWLWHKQFLLVGTAVAAMLLVVTVSLISFYTVPRYPHEDYRPLLRDIAARATPDDTLLASYQWQLGFYQAYLPHPRPNLFTVPGWGRNWSSQAGHAAQLTADLTEILNHSPRLWFPAYQAGGHIWEDEAEAAIARLGYPALLRWYSPQTKLTLAGPGQNPTSEIAPANFENRLQLLKGTVGGHTFEAGRGIIPVQLLWQKRDNLGSAHRVSLRLVDAAGRTWATRDSHPQAGQAFFTDFSVGHTLTDRHGLLTPAGAPPGRYRLLLSVRRASDAHPLDLLDDTGQPLGAELPLAEVRLVLPQPPVGAAALPVQVATNYIFGQAVRLVGYSLGQDPFQAGDALPFTLFWESLAAGPGPLTVLVGLKDSAGQTVFSHQQPPTWPATQWQPGSILRDPQSIILAPDLPPGQYRLEIGLLKQGQTPLVVGGGQPVELTTITTSSRPHVFEAPTPEIKLDLNFGRQARLVGADLPRTQLKPGEALKLALYWQALATFDKNWTVFVHLTNSQGQIMAQQDQVPGQGQFPTTGWVPNEFLVDSYSLQLPPEMPPGRYRLKIGLYDATDFSRLPVLEAGQTVGDHVTLESWPILVE